jgi:hypothetical protein
MSAELDISPANDADRLRILIRYPDYWARIKTLFDSSDDFRLLCYEYGLAVDALSKLNNQSESDVITRYEEYSDIVSELDLELLKYFNEYVM